MRTQAGNDWQALVMASTEASVEVGTGAYAPATFMALSTDQSAAAPTDTFLAGEITAGPLARDQAAFAHTTGAASYTLSRTIDTDAAVQVYKMAFFTARSGGTMAFVTDLPGQPALSAGQRVIFTDTFYF